MHNNPPPIPRSIRSGKRIFRVSPLILRNCGVTSFATIITVSRLSNATIDDNWRNWRWDLVWFGRGLVDGRDRFIATSERPPPNLSIYSRLSMFDRDMYIYIEYIWDDSWKVYQRIIIMRIFQFMFTRIHVD